MPPFARPLSAERFPRRDRAARRSPPYVQCARRLPDARADLLPRVSRPRSPSGVGRLFPPPRGFRNRGRVGRGPARRPRSTSRMRIGSEHRSERSGMEGKAKWVSDGKRDRPSQVGLRFVSDIKGICPFSPSAPCLHPTNRRFASRFLGTGVERIASSP